MHNAGLILGVTSASDSAPSCSPDSDEAWAYFHQVYVLAFKRGLAPALACTGLKHVVAVSAVGCNATQASCGIRSALCAPHAAPPVSVWQRALACWPGAPSHFRAAGAAP